VKIQGHYPAGGPLVLKTPFMQKRVFVFLVAETTPAGYITINMTAIFNILKFNRNKTYLLTTNQTGGL